MVRLEEVEDEEFVQSGEKDLFGDDDEFTDTDSELSEDDEPSAYAVESIAERLTALKDMVPPAARRRIGSTFDTVSSYFKTGLWFGGKGAWVVSTSALLWGIPFALALVEEQQIQEMEKEQKMREMGNELLTPGAQSVVPEAAKPAL